MGNKQAGGIGFPGECPPGEGRRFVKEETLGQDKKELII
jgi:hypothetical protein